ncbi:MAG: hypothetical protein R3F54_13210 [Alphaproteobacteria bacterium]
MTMTEKKEDTSEEIYWLDQPRNISLLVWLLVVICIVLFFSDAFYHKHAIFEIEHLFGFYGVFGFTVYVGLVMTAKWLRNLLMRPEDYYERDDEL